MEENKKSRNSEKLGNQKKQDIRKVENQKIGNLKKQDF